MPAGASAPDHREVDVEAALDALAPRIAAGDHDAFVAFLELRGAVVSDVRACPAG